MKTDFTENLTLLLKRMKERAIDGPVYLTSTARLTTEVIDPTKKLPMDRASVIRRNITFGMRHEPLVPYIDTCFEVTSETIINGATLAKLWAFLEKFGYEKDENLNRLLKMIGVEYA